MAAYLIWSNQHAAWWRQDGRGYTDAIEEAGRYERARAEQIVADQTCNGQLTQPRTDTYTGRSYLQTTEVLVLAPEDIPADLP